MSKTKKIDSIGRVVKLTRQINVSLNKVLSINNNIWLIGFNPGNSSAKILLSSGEIVEIPNNAYVDLRDYFIGRHKEGYFKIRNTVSQ